MIDLNALESCIARFESLERLENVTPQSRGQQFNQLIADILLAHHIHAFANQRSIGEIDVSFRTTDKRFILEAKWETPPINFDPITKLGTRVNQRVQSNFGIMLSMSGFTSCAIEDMEKAGRPNVLVFGPDIFKALLLGTIEAGHLIDACLDLAAFEGSYCPTLQDVFKYLPKRNNKQVDVNTFCHNASNEIIESLRPQGNISEYEVVLSNLPVGQCGISNLNSKTYVTLTDGIYKLENKNLKKLVDVDSPQNRAVFSELHDATLFVYEGSVVAVDQDAKFKPLTKRYPGNVQLFQSAGNIHLMSNGDDSSRHFFPTRILMSLDKMQTEVICDYPVISCRDAAVMEDGVYVVCGSGGLRLYRDNLEIWHVDSSNCAAVEFDRGRILFLENGVRLKSVDMNGNDLRKIVDFPLSGSVGDFSVIGKDEYYFHLYYRDINEKKSCIVRVKTF